MSLEGATGSKKHAGAPPPACCPFYHEAVELIGRRWTGAIVAVLLDHGPLRFSEIAQAVPELSDRLLSERMKELEARGLAGAGRPPARRRPPPPPPAPPPPPPPPPPPAARRLGPPEEPQILIS